MNNKEYFEKQIVPYRHKVRDLKIDLNDLRIREYRLKIENNKLLNIIEKQKEEIEELSKLMNMTKEDRDIVILGRKKLVEVSTIMNMFTR